MTRLPATWTCFDVFQKFSTISHGKANKILSRHTLARCVRGSLLSIRYESISFQRKPFEKSEFPRTVACCLRDFSDVHSGNKLSIFYTRIYVHIEITDGTIIASQGFHATLAENIKSNGVRLLLRPPSP